MHLLTQSSLFCTELRIFPDRFVVCVSQLPFGPDTWTSQNEKSVCMKNKFCDRFFLVLSDCGGGGGVYVVGVVCGGGSGNVCGCGVCVAVMVMCVW